MAGSVYGRQLFNIPLSITSVGGQVQVQKSVCKELIQWHHTLAWGGLFPIYHPYNW